MPVGDIDPDVRTKFAHMLAELPAGTCFTRCDLSSLSNIVLRCWIAMPERMVRFMVITSSVRDGRGEVIPTGQMVPSGTKGWVLGELAGISNSRSHWTVVRIRQVEGDWLEVEVDGQEVISLT